MPLGDMPLRGELQGPASYNCTPLVSAPSTTKLVLVMKLAAGLDKKAAALASSCGVPMRPVGFRPSAILKNYGLPVSIWFQILLADAGAHGVLRVDKVAQAHLPALAEPHVGVPAVMAVLGFHPQDQLFVGDAGGVFERAGAADGHDHGFVFKPWPFHLPALDEVDLDGGGAGKFHRRAADLAVALAGVCVTDEQPPALGAHGQVGDAARAHVGQVHVAAMGSRV